MTGETAFWDTSALVPLCCRQTESADARLLARRYHRMVVWWGTRVEAFGALARLKREGALSDEAFGQTRARLSALSRAWLELLPVESVREEAEGLLLKHNVRAADAFQLSAALVWCHGHPQRRIFVCFDRRLGEAASSIGFEVRSKVRGRVRRA
ncbi:MAG TPA: type II toxin-antitoxin system VapC family toxin [Terriglobia bacterium]|nr:type II toxin-antitoxin system VapC family toxin [Terriglobia bacterium]